MFQKVGTFVPLSSSYPRAAVSRRTVPVTDHCSRFTVLYRSLTTEYGRRANHEPSNQHPSIPNHTLCDLRPVGRAREREMQKELKSTKQTSPTLNPRGKFVSKHPVFRMKRTSLICNGRMNAVSAHITRPAPFELRLPVDSGARFGRPMHSLALQLVVFPQP
jgi:hypothetical protein